MSKVKFLIVGRTASGKDTLTNYICETFNLTQLLSYTTRPRRYENENTHIFVSDEEAKEILLHKPIIAYTEIGEYKYFGLYEQFLSDDIYIIDYEGIKYLKYNFHEQLNRDNIEIVVIYVYTPYDIRIERALSRCNNEAVLMQRINAENTQFNQMEQKVNYDWFVNNTNGERAKKIMSAIINLYK